MKKEIKKALKKLGIEKGDYKEFSFSPEELENLGWNIIDDFKNSTVYKNYIEDDNYEGAEKYIQKCYEETDVIIFINWNADNILETMYGFSGGNSQFPTGDNEKTIFDVLSLIEK